MACAGIKVIGSYEHCPSAARTARKNLGLEVHEVDILNYDLKNFPTNIDLVVGSPPCTEFSYSNRGGSGNVSDGLRHVVQFLKIVEHVRPHYWAMENVPRLATILFEQRKKYRRFRPFDDLLSKASFEVLDASAYGLPQRRSRCIIGNIPFDLLTDYASKLGKLTLGDAIRVLETDPVRDPNFLLSLPIGQLTEHEKEPSLDWEEQRINREAKQHHPVYNCMAFPDRLDRPVRTITATCTRVSRESVIIPDGERTEAYRRLTLRERALLQGFPVTYQFLGDSAGEKMRLIGNAIPPALSYYVGNAVLDVSVDNLTPLAMNGAISFQAPRFSCITRQDRPGAEYRSDRRFRFAIPGLRFKSGMRFDLRNRIDRGQVSWQIEFYFGPSKDIRQITIDQGLMRRARACRSLREVWKAIEGAYKEAAVRFEDFDPVSLQKSWTTKTQNGSPPVPNNRRSWCTR